MAYEIKGDLTVKRTLTSQGATAYGVDLIPETLLAVTATNLNINLNNYRRYFEISINGSSTGDITLNAPVGVAGNSNSIRIRISNTDTGSRNLIFDAAYVRPGGGAVGTVALAAGSTRTLDLRLDGTKWTVTADTGYVLATASATIFPVQADITARDALTGMNDGDLVSTFIPPSMWRYQSGAWTIWNTGAGDRTTKVYTETSIPDNVIDPATFGRLYTALAGTSGADVNIGYPTGNMSHEDELEIFVESTTAVTRNAIFHNVYKDSRGNAIGTVAFPTTAGFKSFIFRKKTTGAAGTAEYWLVGGSEYSPHQNRLFLSNTSVAPATAGAPTLAEITTAIGTNRDVVAYYNGGDTSTVDPTYVYHVDHAGAVTLIQAPGNTPVPLSRIQVGISTQPNVGSATHVPFDVTMFKQGPDLSLAADGRITGLKGGKTYKIEALAPHPGIGSGIVDWRIVDLTNNATLGVPFQSASNNDGGNQDSEPFFTGYIKPSTDIEIGLDHTGGTIGEIADRAWLIVEEVPTNVVADATTTPANRYFLSNTSVAPATAGAPTLAEISAALAGTTNVVAYYTGTDISTDAPTYVYHVDNAGTVTLIESPAQTLPTPANAIPPAATDATGAIGTTTTEYALEDHKHPAQAVSADAEQLLKAGTDGLHMLDPDDLVSADAGNSLVKGSDAKLKVTGVPTAANAIPPAATDATGAIGTTTTEYALEDHKHPAQGVSATAGNVLTVDATDGLHFFAGWDRVFLSNTAVSPATAGSPTITEITTAAGVNRNVILYYTGTDTATDTPTFVYHIDKSGVVTLIQEPAGAGGITYWAATTSYKKNQAVVGPDGSLLAAAADFTSGATFDNTKWVRLGQALIGVFQANTYYWADTLVLGTTGSLVGVTIRRVTAGTSGASLNATELANWTLYAQPSIGPFIANTEYLTGQTVSVDGVIYQSGSTHTSAASFDADIASWAETAQSSRTLERVTQTAHGFSVKQPVYHDGTNWKAAQANADATVAQAIITQVVDTNTFVITTHGVATITGHGLTVGSYYYLDQASSAITPVKPTSGISQGVLHVRDVNTVFIDVELAVSASTATTSTALGRTGAYRTTTLNPGSGNAIKFETLFNTSVNITEALVASGTADLVAGKTYRIAAGVRMESPASGYAHWYIRTTTGTNISPRISLDSANAATNNSSMSNVEVIYTPTANETIGLYLDAASTVGEAGPGTYMSVEELPSQTSVDATAVSITNGNGVNGQTLVTNGDGTATWENSGLVPINFQTGTAYTLVLTDAGKLIDMNNAAANTLTIPDNATVAFPVGTTIAVEMGGAGTTTITGAAGVTVNSSGGLLNISGQYASVSLLKKATDTWTVVGSLA